MSDLPTKRYEKHHAQKNDGDKYAGLCAEARSVANLFDPWHDTVEEAKSHDIFEA